MWRDPEALGAATPAPARTSRFSPLLQSFELNPLRILRVAASATTAEAAFEAERVLTLARADMAPDVPDPLPWLPGAGLPEIQQAAQTVEEPLLRLKNQLLWFDFALDPHGEALATALRSRSEADVAAYLQLKPAPAEPPVPAPAEGEDKGPDAAATEAPAKEAPAESAPAVEPTAAAQTVAEDHPAVALAINQANLCLLVAACRIDGVWPEAGRARPAAEPLPEKNWQAFGKARAMAQAHLATADAPSSASDDIRALWQDGFARWMALLRDPKLGSFIVSRIEAIEDDFAQADDAAAIEESIRVQLADFAAQEIRFLLMSNRYGLTSALMSGLAASSIEARVLTPAMRPVRQLLQTELASFDPILERAEGDKAEPVAHYLRRLAIVRDRWLAIDQGGLAGTRDLIDQAAERVYLRFRQWEKPTSQTDDLLQQASGIASAQSLRERIATLRSQHQERRELICHFCHENDPDYDKPVVLKGKKETGRTRSGNTTTIHYQTWARVVMRCGRCATLHDFERNLSLALTTFTIVTIVILALLGLEGYHVAQSHWYDYSSRPSYTPYAPSASTTDDASSSTGSSSNSGASDLSSAADSAHSIPVAPPVDDFTMTKPDANGTTELTEAELRYCLVTQIKIHAESAELDRIKGVASQVKKYNRNVPGYNALVQAFSSSCANRNYLQSTNDSIEFGINSRRQKIEADARASIR